MNEERFAAASKKWSRLAWDTLHTRTFYWCGRRMEQVPADVLRIQEVVYQVKPDVIVEVGVQEGGSLLYYAMLMHHLNDNGLVIGVDRNIAPAAALIGAPSRSRRRSSARRAPAAATRGWSTPKGSPECVLP